jgi:hypothetical protein
VKVVLDAVYSLGVVGVLADGKFLFFLFFLDKKKTKKSSTA